MMRPSLAFTFPSWGPSATLPPLTDYSPTLLLSASCATSYLASWCYSSSWSALYGGLLRGWLALPDPPHTSPPSPPYYPFVVYLLVASGGGVGPASATIVSAIMVDFLPLSGVAVENIATRNHPNGPSSTVFDKYSGPSSTLTQRELTQDV